MFLKMKMSVVKWFIFLFSLDEKLQHHPLFEKIFVLKQ